MRQPVQHRPARMPAQAHRRRFDVYPLSTQFVEREARHEPGEAPGEVADDIVHPLPLARADDPREIGSAAGECGRPRIIIDRQGFRADDG